MTTIRPARPEDGEELRRIERSAGERFREVGLDDIAEDEPPTLDTLTAYADAGRSWVAVDDAGAPVGYVLVDDVDGCGHIEQVSVRADHHGRGIGRALIERAVAWAIETGRPAVTLTTFADVAWNRPLYEHLGFRVVSEADLGPGLRAIRDVEAAHGLDRASRVCMRLGVGR